MAHRPVFVFPCVFYFVNCQVFAQENANFQNVQVKLARYASHYAPEKIYLQTDKDFYTYGETIWFQTYLLNGITHLPSHKSNVVYVDLVDANDSLVAQRKLYTNFRCSNLRSAFGQWGGGGLYPKGINFRFGTRKLSRSDQFPSPRILQNKGILCPKL